MTAAQTPRAECQICERHQALKGGKLYHHGFNRPGWGFLVGGCPGSQAAPFPAFDVLETVARQVREHAETQVRLAVELPSLYVVTSWKAGAYGGRQRAVWSMVERAQAERLIEDFDTTKALMHGMFLDKVLSNTRRIHESEARQASAEATRLEARLEIARAA